jgi:hypothetical protein
MTPSSSADVHKEKIARIIAQDDQETHPAAQTPAIERLFFKDLHRDEHFEFARTRPGPLLVGEHPTAPAPYERITKFTFRVVGVPGKAYTALFMEPVKLL